MPYQIIKYENVSLKNRVGAQTERESIPTAGFLVLVHSGGLRSVCYMWTLKSITARCCVAKAPKRREKRLLSSLDCNHDLSVLLFCIKLSFMITLIALFMRLTCYYARALPTISGPVNPKLQSRWNSSRPCASIFRRTLRFNFTVQPAFCSSMRSITHHHYLWNRDKSRVCNRHQIMFP